jgi:hypothetical protein
MAQLQPFCRSSVFSAAILLLICDLRTNYVEVLFTLYFYLLYSICIYLHMSCFHLDYSQISLAWKTCAMPIVMCVRLILIDSYELRRYWLSSVNSLFCGNVNTLYHLICCKDKSKNSGCCQNPESRNKYRLKAYDEDDSNSELTTKPERNQSNKSSKQVIKLTL